jgi:hypothetical protein
MHRLLLRRLLRGSRMALSVVIKKNGTAYFQYHRSRKSMDGRDEKIYTY